VTGNRVLYVGDHIYGDMVRSKKDSAWRTAMVIPELEAEVAAHKNAKGDNRRAAELHTRRFELEEQLRVLQQRLKDLSKRHGNGSAAAHGGNGHGNGELAHAKHVLATIRKQLRALERESTALKRQIDHRFHPYWGSLLKEQHELSLFGHQVSEYACVYTSRVSNLYGYSPHQYFRSPHNQMHHEL
jgi:hypothetical protein